MKNSNTKKEQETEDEIPPIKNLRGYYVIAYRNGDIRKNTLKPSKNESIKEFMEGGTVYTWSDYKELGWRCVKVDVTFNEYENKRNLKTKK